MLAVVGAGCLSSVVDEPVAAEASEIGSCDAFMCGTNSPQIAEFGFWELQMPPVYGTPGAPNNVGMQVLLFVHNAAGYLPRVVGGRLYAIPAAGGPALSGPALVNGWFYLRNGTRAFKLRIAEVGWVDSWATSLATGKPVSLETYKLDWTELINGNWGDFRNMCKNPPSRESGELMTMTGANMYRTLVFEGDRIKAEPKLDTGIDVSWFNLGCAGSALAKMALTGHTEASHVTHAFETTLDERQTMLKMLTADYCGDGKPFTVAGQPLNWRDDHGTMKLAALMMSPPQPLAREARWTPNGAACLDKPRVDAHWTSAGSIEFGPDVYAQVQSHCASPIPPCSGNTLETEGYHLLTATVPFQP
ncbi:MAG TPA: ADYC domain-containing protein [Kofleriaceae bacterium]|nr:ADYC domain-containing protein [Kofleriaceae bacterium]